jgi:drug/metabolite transporter (DMT)-like permease
VNQPRRPSEGAGAALVVLAACGFATLGPTSRFAFAAGVDPLILVLWRAAIGGLFVVAVALVLARLGQVVARPWREIPPRQRLTNVAAGLLNGVLNFAALLAVSRISIALTVLVFYTYPAMVAVVSTIFFGERLDRTRWAALGISLVGLVLVLIGAGQIGELDALGVALAFIGAVCQVVYALSAKHGFPSVPAPQASGVTFASAAAAYLLAVVVLGQTAAVSQPLASGAALVPVLIAGTVGAGIPTMAWIVGIRILGPPRAAIISTLEPVVAVVLAALLVAEIPSPLQLVGGACIVVAAIVVQRRPGLEATDHEAVESPDPERTVDRTILPP